MLRSLLFLALLSAVAVAGGGPETTLLVVNGRSALSREVAREYVKLRDIPRSHVVVLDGVPNNSVIKLDVFLERIWKPVAAHMGRLGIEKRIELIAYSVDFPYAVDFRDRIDGNPGQQIGGVAALTGVTYLIGQVLDERPFWLAQTNRYFRLSGGARRFNDAERALWARASELLQGKKYDEAATALEELSKTFGHSNPVWYNLACCYARAGKKKKALDALQKAVDTGWSDARHATGDPDLASLRFEPRFKKLLRAMPQAQRPRGPAFTLLPSIAFSRETYPYYLAVQLGYTGRYGNSVPEILAYLRAARAADGTSPDGTVYICKNGDVRSTTREPFFANTVERLKALGRKVEILDNTTVPKDKTDVFGAVVGTANFRWTSRILPGAICEHLTSYGAHFGRPGQTKISEFLRHGAAGSSGSVIEPLALSYKFPVPQIHVFYAEGCSLAEAFYQSLQGPYQTMVVGDGLARPFAAFEKVTPDNADELWVDGVRQDGKESAPVGGEHDVRWVKIADGPIATRSYRKTSSLPDEPAPEYETLEPVERPAVLHPGLIGDGRILTNIGDQRAGLTVREQVGKKRVDVKGLFEVKADGLYQFAVSGQGRVRLLGKELVLGDQAYLPLRLKAGIYPITLTADAPEIVVMLGGAQVFDAPTLYHAGDPPPKREPSQEADGKGFMLRWKRTQSHVRSVVIYAKADAKEFPTLWEVKAGKKPVKALETLVARTRKNKKQWVSYVELHFKPTRVKTLRLVPNSQAAVERIVVGTGK